MSLFSLADFDEHEQVTFFSEPQSGLRAIVAIHDSGPMGTAGGGCRMWPYPDDDDALRDVLRLSRAMTYKLALVGIPAGGAKSVVIADPTRDKTDALLRALGRAVQSLGGRYVIAEDVGTSAADMHVIKAETAFVMTARADTSAPTAYGTFIALRAAVQRRLQRENLEGMRIAIQGVGGVGRRLCAYLASEGASLFISDARPSVALEVASRCGAEVVAPERLLALDVDVVCPCALGAVLDEASIAKLRCKVVVGAANNQLAEDRHAALLRAREILYVPDFAVNVGGVLGAAGIMVAEGGTDDAPTFRHAERIADLLHAIFERADRTGVSPHEAATAIAQQKVREFRQARLTK